MSTMRKRLVVAGLALLGVLVLAAIVGGTVGYYRVYKPILRPVGYVGALDRFDETIVNKSPFRPPDSGELTEQQWSRYRDVKAAVMSAVGPSSADVFVAAKAALLRTTTPAAPRVEYRTALQAIGEIGPAFIAAKAAQVKALNNAGLSRDEYRWVERQVFAASDVALQELDVQSMKTAPQDGRNLIDVRSAAVAAGAASANRRFVPERRSDLARWAALAFFGL
jgi:hypothetical protein